VLVPGTEPKDDDLWRSFVSDARKLGIALVVLERATDRSLHDLVHGLRQSKAGGFLPLIPGSASFWAELQARSGLPGLFASPEAAREGGFLGLGANDEDTARRAVAVAARILRGESPAVVPVDQSIVFDLAVNLRTARSLGIVVPQSILIQATAIFD
jgi:putative ABC transport system substrate-binding protein